MLQKILIGKLRKLRALETFYERLPLITARRRLSLQLGEGGGGGRVVGGGGCDNSKGQPPPPPARVRGQPQNIWALCTGGRYASYWNAFLFKLPVQRDSNRCSTYISCTQCRPSLTRWGSSGSTIDPGFELHQYLLTGMWMRMGSAAILATKRSAGVAQKANLMEHVAHGLCTKCE